jgi:hypothetical protein
MAPPQFSHGFHKPRWDESRSLYLCFVGRMGIIFLKIASLPMAVNASEVRSIDDHYVTW